MNETAVEYYAAKIVEYYYIAESPNTIYWFVHPCDY